MPSEEQFLYKLGEIPVLNDGWTTAWDYYSKVKDYSSVTKFALGVTESGVKKAAAISTPVIHHFQPQINTVNSYACSKLDDIERKYPIIKQPSKEIKEACIEYVQPVVGRVKPVVTYVQVVVDNSKKRVERMKSSSINLLTDARDLGVNTVSHAVNVTFDTPPGRLVTRTVDGVLTYAEGLVDRYIPEEPQEADGDDSTSGSTERHENVEEMEEMEPSPQRVVVHLRTVSKKLRERMFKRAKSRTLDTLTHLHSAVDLIDYAKKNLEATRDKVQDLWTQITDTSDQPRRENECSAWNVEERIVLIGRTLAQQLRSGVSALEKASSEAGQFIRHPITRSKEFTDFVYELTANVKNTNVEKARAYLHSIQTKLRAVIDSVDLLTVDAKNESTVSEDEDLNSTETSEEDETETPESGNHI